VKKTARKTRLQMNDERRRAHLRTRRLGKEKGIEWSNKKRARKRWESREAGTRRSEKKGSAPKEKQWGETSRWTNEKESKNEQRHPPEIKKAREEMGGEGAIDKRNTEERLRKESSEKDGKR